MTLLRFEALLKFKVLQRKFQRRQLSDGHCLTIIRRKFKYSTTKQASEYGNNSNSTSEENQITYGLHAFNST